MNRVVEFDNQSMLFDQSSSKVALYEDKRSNKGNESPTALNLSKPRHQPEVKHAAHINAHAPYSAVLLADDVVVSKMETAPSTEEHGDEGKRGPRINVDKK